MLNPRANGSRVSELCCRSVSGNLTRPLYTKKRRIKRMQIAGAEGIYKVPSLFQAIFPHHVDCKLIDGKEIYLKLNSHH